MPRDAVLAVARRELRRRWRGVVALGVAAGLTGGVVAASLQVQQRGSTAYDRLVNAVALEDARVFLPRDPALAAELAHAPGVATAYQVSGWIGEVVGRPKTYVGMSGAESDGPRLGVPVVVAGRAPDPGAADEVLLGEPVADALGLRPGDHLRLALLTPEDNTSWDQGFEPHGPRVDVQVTGIGRMPVWDGYLGYVSVTPAFAARYGDVSLGSAVVARLRAGSAAHDAFAAAVDTLARRTGGDRDPSQAVRVTFPRAAADPAFVSARGVLSGGLLALAGVAGLGGLLLVGQGLSRHHATGARDQRVEAALGLTRAERTVARVLPATVGAVVAALVVVGAGALAAGVEPIGELAGWEPSPGRRLDVPVVAVTAVATGAAFLGLAARAARRAGRPATDAARSGARNASRRPRLPRRPALMLGGAFLAPAAARRDGADEGTASGRPALLGAAVLVAGVVAAATFGTSLHRLGTTPVRYGWTSDLSVVDVKDAQLAAFARDDRVAAVTLVEESTIRLGGADIAAVAPMSTKGAMPWTTLDGRLPRTAAEIALGPRLAATLGAGPGDRVTAQGRAGAVPLTVTGIVLKPATTGEHLGQSAVVGGGDLDGLASSPVYRSAFVLAAPGHAAAVAADLAGQAELALAEPPQEVTTLAGLSALPWTLGIFLGLAAVAALAHGLWLTVRRRRRDLAVARALGFTPRQVLAAVAVTALAAGGASLVVGVPLGLGLGRLVWASVASSASVAPDAVAPVGLLAGTALAVLLCAVMVALVPAYLAVRRPPATHLHVE